MSREAQWLWAGILAIAAWLAACGPPRIPEGPPGEGGNAGGKYRCADVSGRSDPWLVEWVGTNKARIQAASQDGVLLVRYASCELEVLYGCEREGDYALVATTPSSSTEYITSQEDIFAKLPIGALNLAAEFRAGDRWSLDYVIVGMRRARTAAFGRDALSDGCARATHFVSGMAIGAYRLVSEARRRAGVEAGFSGAGAGASTAAGAGTLRQDGFPETCAGEQARADDPRCQAIVQLFLEPLGERAADEQPAAPASGAGAGAATPPVAVTQKGAASYGAQLEGAWAALRDGAKGADLERRLELYQRFLSDYPVENPHAAGARQEIARIDGALAARAAAEGADAEKERKLAAERERATLIREAYEAARGAKGTAAERLAIWKRFIQAYPGEDNPYLKTAIREAKRLSAQGETSSKEVGPAGVEWVYSAPAGVRLTRSEITVEQYRACVGAGACSSAGVGVPFDGAVERPEAAATCNWGKAGRGKHPMNCIDWRQAVAVCAWLGGRLPTEEEWAAEASDAGGRLWPWAGAAGVSCDRAVWGGGAEGDGCGRGATWPVCSKRGGDSASGLCDVVGNLWEWTSSAYDGEHDWRVQRGGSWHTGDPSLATAQVRGSAGPTQRDGYTGVRCARTGS